MEYEIVTLEEKIAVGVSARTNNASPDMGAVIGGLWNRFYNEGIWASIPCKITKKAMGIYTEYAGDENEDYTVVVACETADEPEQKEYAVFRIPAGRYAKFVIHGDMVQAVAAAWQEIWQMNLPRSFQCITWNQDAGCYAVNVHTGSKWAVQAVYRLISRFGARPAL